MGALVPLGLHCMGGSNVDLLWGGSYVINKNRKKKEQELIFSSYGVFLCWFISCVAISWIVVYLQTLV